MDTHKRNLQKAQDMLSAMQSQRDQAFNALVVANAEIAALRRDVEAAKNKDAEIQRLTARIAKLEAPNPAQQDEPPASAMAA